MSTASEYGSFLPSFKPKVGGQLKTLVHGRDGFVASWRTPLHDKLYNNDWLTTGWRSNALRPCHGLEILR